MKNKMLCPKCGTRTLENSRGDFICPNCGIICYSNTDDLAEDLEYIR